jgi:hypothetical protein
MLSIKKLYYLWLVNGCIFVVAYSGWLASASNSALTFRHLTFWTNQLLVFERLPEIFSRSIFKWLVQSIDPTTLQDCPNRFPPQSPACHQQLLHLQALQDTTRPKTKAFSFKPQASHRYKLKLSEVPSRFL